MMGAYQERHHEALASWARAAEEAVEHLLEGVALVRSDGRARLKQIAEYGGSRALGCLAASATQDLA